MRPSLTTTKIWTTTIDSDLRPALMPTEQTQKTSKTADNPKNPFLPNCSEPATFCSSLPTHTVSFANSWTCRSCFRINAYYKRSAYNVPSWIPNFIQISFKVKVDFVSWGHPVSGVKHYKRRQWEVHLKPSANYESTVSWDANLRILNPQRVPKNDVIHKIKACKWSCQ